MKSVSPGGAAMASTSESSPKAGVGVIVVEGDLFDLGQEAVVGFLEVRAGEGLGLSGGRWWRARGPRTAVVPSETDVSFFVFSGRR